MIMNNNNEGILPDNGDWMKCICGCEDRFFLTPLNPNQTQCSYCFKEIKSRNDMDKFAHRGRIVAILHKSCKPSKLRDLFPTPC